MRCETVTYLERPGCSLLWSRVGIRRLQLPSELWGGKRKSRNWDYTLKLRLNWWAGLLCFSGIYYLGQAGLFESMRLLRWPLKCVCDVELSPSRCIFRGVFVVHCYCFMCAVCHLGKTWAKGSGVDEAPLNSNTDIICHCWLCAPNIKPVVRWDIQPAGY